MPIYEYECTECGEHIERLQRLNDPAPEACESCGGAMRRLLSAPAFQFKGTGWYVTDYAGKSAGGTEGKTPSEPSRDKDAKAETAKPATAATGSSASADD